MSSWSDRGVRATVLRGGDAALARPARMDSELRTSPFASVPLVDARLTDPVLEDVVEQARTAAAAQGQAAGYADGYTAGLSAAAEEAAQSGRQAERERRAAEKARADEVQAAVQVLTAAAHEFGQAQQVALADIEDAAVDLALGIARAVLDRELETSRDPGREAVARALALAPQGSAATVRLHPDDAAAMSGLDVRPAGAPVTIVPDPAVERGGCVLEAAGRRVDARVGPALARVAAVLR